MKFVLLVEGQTERKSAAEFLKRWLDPRLKKPVGILPVKFDGYAGLVRKIVTKTRLYLDAPQNSDIIAVIGLLDLYGPEFYPEGTTGAQERHAWGVRHFESEVDRSRFRMFFAVHEFEAWLLSQPEIFRQEVQKRLPNRISAPETVNFDKPPSKLLNQIYLEATNKRYKKTTDGGTLFRKLQPDVAVDKCPYLKEMLEEMLLLAKAAGL